MQREVETVLRAVEEKTRAATEVRSRAAGSAGGAETRIPRSAGMVEARTGEDKTKAERAAEPEKEAELPIRDCRMDGAVAAATRRTTATEQHASSARPSAAYEMEEHEMEDYEMEDTEQSTGHSNFLRNHLPIYLTLCSLPGLGSASRNSIYRCLLLAVLSIPHKGGSSRHANR